MTDCTVLPCHPRDNQQKYRDLATLPQNLQDRIADIETRLNSLVEPEVSALCRDLAEYVETKRSELQILEGYKVEADRECERLRAEVERLARACADGWGEPTLINTLRERAETAEAAIKAERERCRLLASGMGFMALAQEIARGET